MMRNLSSNLFVALILLAIGVGCSRFAVPGKVDLFEGDNVVKAVAKIKEKVGVETVKVMSAEVHANEMTLTVRSPTTPKNVDKYTYKDGSVTGPVPTIGNLEKSGDEYPYVQNIDDIGWANIPATVKQALAVANLENGHVSVISMDWQYASNAHPEVKEQYAKKKAEKEEECRKQQDSAGCLYRLMTGPSETPLVFTWRVFLEGPRGRKDFWADKDGKLNEKGF